jgi:hypothetical protein
MLNSWVVMLHASRSGTASIGGTKWNNIAPVIAENAKPARPAANEPAKMMINVVNSVT